ncbi:BTB/POZ domain-containing protein [Fadolivirus algeromassiliense]|jgi:hypothetical protein|uniref:BTB/POZ domain-containing protein n=1 Tax=Fadolivirus FV1/VV64 TaxID=3070911 RepID=A0A7D3UUY5_9VIRU|nr:BTB/POZ domain-containing protein [Fadolivirus algeromassiliense]QKF94491.1 BTB/POZ domain-containing protein [Fadolivirus FV1/VV64]
MNVINLNVGGHTFYTFKSTLEKIPYFNAHFETWSKDNSEIFLDTDPDIFKHILNKLRDANYQFPTDPIILTNIINMYTYLGLVQDDNDADNDSSDDKKQIIIRTLNPNYVYMNSGFFNTIVKHSYTINTLINKIIHIELICKKLHYFNVTFNNRVILSIKNNDILDIYFGYDHTKNKKRYYKLRSKYLEYINVGIIKIETEGQLDMKCVVANQVSS